MANVLFKKGLLANLPSSYVEGTFYVTTDEKAMYLDVNDSTRIRLGDFQEFATLAALQANTNPSTTAMYYVTDLNVLAKWTGTEYKQINPDTGVTSVEVVGEGNAVTAASYDAATRKLTLTKGETFALPADISNAVGELGNDAEGNAYANVKAYVDAKTAGIATDVALGELTERVGTAEGEIDALQEASAKHVDKEEGKSLIADTEITRLAGMSDGANKVEASETNGNIKIDGVETTVYTHPDKHAIADVDGLQDALNGLQVKGDYAAEEHTHTASEVTDLDSTIKGYDYATKTELGDVDKKFADYKTAADQKAIDDEQDRRLGVIEGDYLKAADETELEGKITAEETRAKGVEESLQTQINTIMNNPDAEGAINSINEFTQYVEEHGSIADGFRTDIDKNKEDIAANAKAIADQATSDAATYETKTDASAKLTEAKEYADGLNTAMDTRVKVLEGIDHEAYVAADETTLASARAYTDELANGQVKVNTDAIATKANSADVYAKTETYTQDEVDAAIETAVTNACSWGEF